jgi:hypothetical protein
MKSRRLTSLVLVCSLPLLLPRGWCCIFAGPVKAALTKSPAPRLGCCGCTCCTGEPPASEPRQPHLPRPVKHCPCADRDTTLPSGPEKGDPNLLPSGSVIGPPLPEEALAILVGPVPALPFLPPPLHVLNCLWLC